MSPDMSAAVDVFSKRLPSQCLIRHQADKPIYTLITVDNWPPAVHYEFRDQKNSADLYIEIHVEDPQFLFVKEVFKSFAAETRHIVGFELSYFESRPWPHRKKWPSLSVAVPKDGQGEVAASVMSALIAATRPQLDKVLAEAQPSILD